MVDLLHELVPRTQDDGLERGRRAMVVTAVLTGMAAFVVALRCYARFGLMKITGREDWAILGALLLSFAYCGLVGGEHHYGMGIHQKYLPAHIVQQQLKCLWAAIPLYNASLGFTKFSILFQYLRIFPARWFRNSCYGIMAIVATYSTWAVVSGYVNCVPVAKFWNHDLPGHCLSFDAVWFFNASMNIATDVTLLLLPMPLLSALQLPRMQKFALMGVFAIGILVVITSILRLSSLRTVASSSDTSYSNVGAAYWTAAECNVAIICACLPFLRPILSVLFPKLLSTNSCNRYTGNDAITANRFTSHRSARQQSQLFSRNDERDYDVYSINVKPGDGSERTSLGGIEVTTEMTVMQETKHDENVSERRLVMDS
ncbi:hypothetical protein N7466_002410 [Penicillium verhagenii]|uniref:uncharacterized protein n=1 Tax=Penicillium verhagenii TaxID=1562060 RepID=UPI002544FE77|nr:uncharacterized protein N7466_002410 [Penicillium verhagenii]KAJ5939276.1 hypothetical protein N7466_002410 [Penicillium verhagenii]